MSPLAIADEDVCAGARLQHEREILRAHRRLEAAQHVVGSDDVVHYVGRELGLGRVVHGRRIIPVELHMSTIGRDLLHADPPIDALIVYNSNPVAVAPQSREVAAGFEREDLFTVVLEHFQTDTADYADFVLPATTQLEHVDVHKSYGHLYMEYCKEQLTGYKKPKYIEFRSDLPKTNVGKILRRELRDDKKAA